ncbi:MAG: S-layer homology domain-containing protein [Firmicutes bacterium]|nr:S-layer homology domain-containing protein [Bacillota bacterium]
MQGDASGFRPSDNITRAEAAAIVARIADTSLRIK